MSHSYLPLVFVFVVVLLSYGSCASVDVYDFRHDTDTDPDWVNCSALVGSEDSCSACAASPTCYWCPSSVDAREQGTCGFLDTFDGGECPT